MKRYRTGAYIVHPRSGHRAAVGTMIEDSKHGEFVRFSDYQKLQGCYDFAITMLEAAGHRGFPPCEDYHMAAAMGGRPCTFCGTDSWVRDET
jgi:hypothetical protein